MTIMRLKHKPLGLLLLTGCMATTGCKTTSWSPTSMFSWNRGADVSALAESEGAEMPESPAAKYTPNAIASVGAGNQAEGADDPSGNPASAYGYTVENQPQTGLAAEANGYATGPYDLGTSSTDSTASMPNPYGGAYGGATPTSPPDIALPQATQDVLAQQQSPAAAYPGAQLPTTPASPQNSMPAGYQTGGAGMLGYPALPTGAAGTPVAAASGTTAPADLPLPGATAQSETPTTPAASAYQGASKPPATGSATTPSVPSTGLPPIGENAAPVNRYAPGTTGRSTNYNFSSPTGG